MQGVEPLILNRLARRDYTITSQMEAGVVLLGQEVKSLRAKHADITKSFVKILNGEVFLVNANIQQFDFTPGKTYDPTRSRKLLLHSRQITELDELLHNSRMTAVPLMIGTSHNHLKVLIGIGKGKRQYERKEELKQRDLKRETERATRRK